MYIYETRIFPFTWKLTCERARTHICMCVTTKVIIENPCGPQNVMDINFSIPPMMWKVFKMHSQQRFSWQQYIATCVYFFPVFLEIYNIQAKWTKWWNFSWDFDVVATFLDCKGSKMSWARQNLPWKCSI